MVSYIKALEKIAEWQSRSVKISTEGMLSYSWIFSRSCFLFAINPNISYHKIAK